MTDRRNNKAAVGILASAVALAVLGNATEAHAQYWLSDRAATQGTGLRVGDFELHPGVGAEVGFDSNTFYASTSGTPIPSLRLRFSPSFSISTLSPQRSGTTPSGSNTDTSANIAQRSVNFSAGIAVIPLVYIPISPIQPELVSRLTNVGGQANVRFEFNPGRTWQFNLSDDFARIVQGSPDRGVALYTFNRIQNTANAELVFAPNAGRVFDFRVGIGNTLAIFTDNANADGFNFTQIPVTLRSRWRFFPKTSLLWQASFSPTIYLNPAAATTLGLFGGFPFGSLIGINGLFSEKITVSLMVGYQGTYFGLGDNASTVVANGEFRYMFSAQTSFRFGAMRDIQPSAIGNYYIRNYGYLAINQSFGSRVYLAADVGGGYYQYGYRAAAGGGPATDITGSTFFDAMTGRFGAVRVEGRAFFEVRATNWLGFNLTGNVSANLTDVSINTRGAPVSIQWVRAEALAGARVAW